MAAFYLFDPTILNHNSNHYTIITSHQNHSEQYASMYTPWPHSHNANKGSASATVIPPNSNKINSLEFTRSSALNLHDYQVLFLI